MPANHIVRPGEHLGSIAKKFGFENFSVLWDHPNNAKLKALRGDPLLLAPGDKVFIPDHTRLVFSRITNSSHDVRVRLDELKLNLRILQLDGKPRKSASVTVRVEPPETAAASAAEEQVLTTDDDGKISVEVAKHVTSGTLIIDGLQYPLSIGQLDPISTETGVEQRLINLGYLRRSEGEVGLDDVRFAIEDFQADNDLPITGKRADIEAALKDVHGS